MYEPPHTCDDLDEAIQRLKKLHTEEDEYTRGELVDEAVDLLNDVRRANAELRQLFHDWRNESEQKHSQLVEAQQQVEQLQQECQELRHELLLARESHAR